MTPPYILGNYQFFKKGDRLYRRYFDKVNGLHGEWKDITFHTFDNKKEEM